MNDEVQSLIREQEDLFWFVPDAEKENVSVAVLVETILNYGSMEAVRQLIRALGLETVARTFAESLSSESRRRNNYHELTRNYFLHVFKLYAPQCFDRSPA